MVPVRYTSSVSGTFANRIRKSTFVPPKKAYSFVAILDDILNFASDTLVDNGRLSFWMPTANDQEQEMPVPTHPCLGVVVVCTQVFNRCRSFSLIQSLMQFAHFVLGSRRLITYRRLPDSEVDVSALAQRKQEEQLNGHTADDLNAFRRAYFKGFRTDQTDTDVVE